jgi:hypothetical protein
MSVATEVTEHVCGAGERRLAVDDPFLGGCLPEQPFSQHRSDPSRLLLQRPVEEIEQLRSKDLGESADGDEKAWSSGKSTYRDRH